MKRAITVLIITGCLALGCQPPDEPSSSAPGPGDPTTGVATAQLEAIAGEAYIFAYPILEQYKMLFMQALYAESGFYEAPLNAISHKQELNGPNDTLVVRPNNDTLYSGAWLDLRAEPIVLSVPAISLDRYYSFQLIDLYTHKFAYVGSRATGPEAGDYLIAGPGWEGETPPGIEGVLRAETDLVVALARTAVYGADDVPNVVDIQKQYRFEPLSRFARTEAPSVPPAPALPPYISDRARSANFVAYVNAILPHLGQHPSEADLWQRFAAIGIGDPAFDPDTWTPEARAAIEAGIESASEKIEAEAASLGSRQAGWMLTEASYGTRELMEGRYLRRAAAAYFGLWGNDLEEAFYPEASLDADGDALDASLHNYTLRLDASDLPPCKSFWSLSMYNLPPMLFIHNPIHRYAIGDRTEGLEYGGDASLTVLLQHLSPGEDRESNWLPAPDGPFSLMMRCYWPEAEALDPLYVPPAIAKAD